MSNGLRRCAIGAALAITAPAFAADAPTDRGWFLEANVLDVESSSGDSPFTFDGEEAGAAVTSGYAFTRNFALQASYHDFGEHSATDCPAAVCTAVPHGDLADIRGLSIAALGTWRVAPAVEAFGKIGVLATDADFERAGFDDTDRGALVGAGVGVWVTPRWRVNLQIERADFDFESAGLGATYRF
jgi:hypothetical protein